jgi:hypothetical protein
MYMIVTIVIPGCINTSMDNMIAKAPRPTNTPRLQLGEFPITALMGQDIYKEMKIRFLILLTKVINAIFYILSA